MHLSAPQPFRLECDWLNAQAFRWTERDGWFYGIVGGQLIRVRNADGDRIEFEGDADADAVKRYFRLDQKIGAVHEALREADPEHMPKLIKDYGYIRVLWQDPWECLVAYICSANASVDSIRGRLNKLATYGDELALDGVSCRAIPSAEQVKKAGVDGIEKLKLGLPHIPDTIHEAATDVTKGKLNLKALSDASVLLKEARARLKNDRNDKSKGYHGIGDKIADCVCLFSLGKDDAFPVDTNIGAALERYGDAPGKTDASKARWARATFGEHAGYAGQLLFLDQRSPLS